MEPAFSRAPGRRGFWSGRRAWPLAILSLLILAGILGALLLPRGQCSPSVKHPPLLKTSPAVEGNLSPFWLDEQTVLLDGPGSPRYEWSLPGNTLRQIPLRSCTMQAPTVGASTGLYSICAGGPTGTLQVVNLLTGVTTLDYNDHLNHSWSDFTLNKEKTRLAALSERGVLQIWDLQTGQSQFTLQLPPTDDLSIGLAWSPDERMLAVNYMRRTLQVWDLMGRRLLYTLVGPGLDGPGELAWAADSTHLGYVDGTYEKTLVDMWDLKTGKLSMTDQVGAVIELSTFQLLAGGQSFLLGSETGQLTLVNAGTHRVVLSQRPSSLGPPSLQVSPDTQLLEVSKAGSNIIDVYDAVTGQKVATYPGLAIQLNLGKQALSLPVMLGSWSPDSRSIASAGQDSHLHVWNARTGQDSASYALQVGYPSAIAWSPEADMIALVTAPDNPGAPASFSSTQGTAYLVSAP